MHHGHSENCEHGKCGCFCHKFNGLLVAIVGLAFLLGTLEVIPQHVVNIVWPVALIFIGLKKSFGRGKCKCCANS